MKLSQEIKFFVILNEKLIKSIRQFYNSIEYEDASDFIFCKFYEAFDLTENLVNSIISSDGVNIKFEVPPNDIKHFKNNGFTVVTEEVQELSFESFEDNFISELFIDNDELFLIYLERKLSSPQKITKKEFKLWKELLNKEYLSNIAPTITDFSSVLDTP